MGGWVRVWPGGWEMLGARRLPAWVLTALPLLSAISRTEVSLKSTGKSRSTPPSQPRTSPTGTWGWDGTGCHGESLRCGCTWVGWDQ